MSFLSNEGIRQALEKKLIRIDPLLHPIQPVSVDIRLGNTIIIPKGGHIIDPLYGIGTTDRAKIFVEHYLQPDEAVLCGTLECIEINDPRITGLVSGKSTLARFFLQIHAAGLVDPGWEGRLTLEIKNLGKDIIVLRPGMKIGQISFAYSTTGPVPSVLYGQPSLNSHYQGSDQVTPGRVEAES